MIPQGAELWAALEDGRALLVVGWARADREGTSAVPFLAGFNVGCASPVKSGVIGFHSTEEAAQRQLADLSARGF